MDRAAGAAVRRWPARAAARSRDDPLEAGLTHPAFEPLRPWLERLPDPLHASLDELNRLADHAALRVDSGARLRFVAPPEAKRGAYGGYEMRAFETGEVATRPESLHDLFNAFAWLAFPRTKAKLNALHAKAIPAEGGTRGRFRDLLTLLDEGGAVVACDDPQLIGLVRELRWKSLFWDERPRLLRGMRIRLLGHAVMERALAPWAGMTCKALFVPASGDADHHAARWLGELSADASPRDLPPLPVFGYPGWHPATADPAFYDDERFFRRSRGRKGRTLPAESRPGSRYGDIEESPGSAERDAG